MRFGIVMRGVRGTGEELLALLGLVLVREGSVGLNGVNGGDNIGGGSEGFVDMEGRRKVGTIGAVPVGVGSGKRRRREARKVPGSGARATGENFRGRGFVFAEHTRAISVARKLRHFH